MTFGVARHGGGSLSGALSPEGGDIRSRLAGKGLSLHSLLVEYRTVRAVGVGGFIH